MHITGGPAEGSQKCTLRRKAESKGGRDGICWTTWWMLVFFKDHTHACTHTHTQPSHLTAFTFYHSGHSQHSVSDQGHSRLLQKVCREGEGGLVEVSKDENEWLSAY